MSSLTMNIMFLQWFSMLKICSPKINQMTLKTYFKVQLPIISFIKDHIYWKQSTKTDTVI